MLIYELGSVPSCLEDLWSKVASLWKWASLPAASDYTTGLHEIYQLWQQHNQFYLINSLSDVNFLNKYIYFCHSKNNNKSNNNNAPPPHPPSLPLQLLGSLSPWPPVASSLLGEAVAPTCHWEVIAPPGSALTDTAAPCMSFSGARVGFFFFCTWSCVHCHPTSKKIVFLILAVFPFPREIHKNLKIAINKLVTCNTWTLNNCFKVYVSQKKTYVHGHMTSSCQVKMASYFWIEEEKNYFLTNNQRVTDYVLSKSNNTNKNTCK